MKKIAAIKRLAECPLPLRIYASTYLPPKQIQLLGLGNLQGKISLMVEKEVMFTMYVYGDKKTGQEHVAVIKAIGNGENVPIRIHSSCLTAETFHASNCDCHEQLEAALEIVDKEGYGGVIWLYQEGRGNGLVAKAKQLKIMFEKHLDTIEAFKIAGYPSDRRSYAIAAYILHDLGVKSVRIISNNPDKLHQIRALGMRVTGRIPCEINPLNEIVRKDLRAKRDKDGHIFNKVI